MTLECLSVAQPHLHLERCASLRSGYHGVPRPLLQGPIGPLGKWHLGSVGQRGGNAGQNSREAPVLSGVPQRLWSRDGSTADWLSVVLHENHPAEA